MAVVAVSAFGIAAIVESAGYTGLYEPIIYAGWVFGLPLVYILGEAIPLVDGGDDGADEPPNAVQQVREAYARGRLSHLEFEKRLDEVLESTNIDYEHVLETTEPTPLSNETEHNCETNT